LEIAKGEKNRDVDNANRALANAEEQTEKHEETRETAKRIVKKILEDEKLVNKLGKEKIDNLNNKVQKIEGELEETKTAIAKMGKSIDDADFEKKKEKLNEFLQQASQTAEIIEQLKTSLKGEEDEKRKKQIEEDIKGEETRSRHTKSRKRIGNSERRKKS
jgi:hypothetical protein